MKNIVLNLHLLEQCNYRCEFCFSRFGSPKTLGLLVWKKIVDNILGYPSVGRINLAGGEPLLLPWLQELANYIHEKGAEVSLITNGSLLPSRDDILRAGAFSMIGLSIDSFNESTLEKLGRCSGNGTPLLCEQYRQLCDLVKKRNLELKINTVVTRLNLYDDFSPIKEIAPKRWKILRMQIFKTGDFDNSHLAIGDEEYKAFCERQKALGVPFVSEDSMRNSYIFVDPAGCLIDNAKGRYTPVGNLLEDDFPRCFRRLPLNWELYERRYNDSGVTRKQSAHKVCVNF